MIQVMDPRTRMILFKLLNQGFFRKIDGCLSTGKEANVYYAVGGEVIICGGHVPIRTTAYRISWTVTDIGMIIVVVVNQ